MVPNPELDTLNLAELADRLADVRTTRTHEGFGTDNAVVKAGLERRIMERVAGISSEDDSKLEIDHPIVLAVQDRKLEAETSEIRAGGLFIPGKANFGDGSEGTVEIKTDNDFRLRVKCVVREIESGEPGVFVAFKSADDPSSRRTTRLILELLQNSAG